MSSPFFGLLRPDAIQRARLIEICDNLTARIAEAEHNRWLGEAEGLKVSLAGAQAKLTQMNQITARRRVGLGIPTFPDVAARTVTLSAAQDPEPAAEPPPPARHTPLPETAVATHSYSGQTFGG